MLNRRAIADIERLQAAFAAERDQQQQQQQQLQQRMQASISALEASLVDTETKRDAAIGRAALMKEQVNGFWVSVLCFRIGHAAEMTGVGVARLREEGGWGGGAHAAADREAGSSVTGSARVRRRAGAEVVMISVGGGFCGCGGCGCGGCGCGGWWLWW